MMKLAKCPLKFVACVCKLRMMKRHTATMFSNTLNKVVESDGGTTGSVTRNLPKMVFEVNKKDVMVEVQKYHSTWREDATMVATQ